MAQIVWTPEGSESGVGSVVMKRPLRPLTMEVYRGFLAGRITRMVRRAGLEQAAELLSSVEIQEGGANLSSNPLEASEYLVWDSEILAERSGMMGERWPLRPGQIKADSSLTPEMVEAETLEDWLGLLYRGLI